MTPKPTLPTKQCPVSPTKAAQLLNTSRRTIMRAIESHNLKASRDNRNHWKIVYDDLRKWADAHWTPTEHIQPKLPNVSEAEMIEIRAENKQLKERILSMEEDIFHWRNIAQSLSKRSGQRWFFK